MCSEFVFAHPLGRQVQRGLEPDGLGNDLADELIHRLYADRGEPGAKVLPAPDADMAFRKFVEHTDLMFLFDRFSFVKGQYLKLLPPINSRSREVGGISDASIGMKLSRKWSIRRASSYSGTVSGTSRKIGSAKGRSTDIS